MKKRLLSLIMTAVLAAGIIGCGSSTADTSNQTTAENTETATTENKEQETQATEETQSTEPKILKTAASFAYPSLDVHKEYYGWYTSIYGVSH